MKIEKLIMPIATLTLTLALSSGAHAHGHCGPCRQDLQALCPSVTPGPGHFRDCLETICPDVTPGPGGFATCLQQHSDQLSAACQDHLKQMQARIDAWRQACGGDVQTLCGDVSGRHAIGKCLREHQDQLSQACQDLLAQHHRRDHHRGMSDTPPTS